METRLFKAGVKLAMVAFVAATLVGCGGATQGYVPPPPGNGYGYYGGACGGVGGQPVRSDGQPFFASLQGGNPANSLQLQLYYVTGRNPDTTTQNVVGTANVNLAELQGQQQAPQPYPGQYPTQGGAGSPFCVSSSSAGAASPGLYYQNNALAISMQGTAQTPAMVISPYGAPSPYGGGYAPTIPMPVTVTIGQVPGCPPGGNCPPCAGIANGRVQGCVTVLFTNGPQFSFSAQ